MIGEQFNNIVSGSFLCESEDRGGGVRKISTEYLTYELVCN